MELFLSMIALVDHAGLVMTGLCGAALAVGMPLLLVVGLIDGPKGGRIAARALKANERRVTTPTSGAHHVAPTPERKTA
jgi:hypothetical protein